MGKDKSNVLIKPCIVVFFDLDGTLWDHLDVSSMTLPFRLVGEGLIEDANGERLRVFDSMIELVEFAKSLGAVVSTLSWNRREYAMEALKLLGIDGLFDYHAIESDPDKYKYMSRVLLSISDEMHCNIRPECIIYVDDRRIHLSDIKQHIGDILFIDAGWCRKHIDECRNFIGDTINNCKNK